MPKKGGWRSPTRSVHPSDVENRAFGTGDPTSSVKTAGKKRATWSRINLTGGGAGPVVQYDVPHDLGEVPTVVTLKHYEKANGGITITARGVRAENWSHSHVHVEVTLVAGATLDGTLAAFLVEGR